jgi:hypothetical protein
MCVKIKKTKISNKEKGRMKMMNTHVQISDWEGIQTQRGEQWETVNSTRKEK